MSSKKKMSFFFGRAQRAERKVAIQLDYVVVCMSLKEGLPDLPTLEFRHQRAPQTFLTIVGEGGSNGNFCTDKTFIWSLQ